MKRKFTGMKEASATGRDPLHPTLGLLCKLSSVCVHVEEGIGIGAHSFDAYALQTCLQDPEIVEWLAGMRRLGLAPEKRP